VVVVPLCALHVQYQICESDQAAPVQYQEGIAEMAGSKMVRCTAGHSPMLLQTSILAGKIVECVERVVGELGSWSRRGNEMLVGGIGRREGRDNPPSYL
jgi:hypothetical protein